MARHSLYPNSITINYTTNGHSHKQVLPIKQVSFTDPGWTVQVRVGSNIEWGAAVDQYALLMAGLIADTDSIDSAELFSYEATDAPGIFLDAHPIDQVGVNIGTAQPWTQLVMPFKTTGGTQLRLTVLEGVTGSDAKNTFAAETDALLCDYMEYILGDDDFIITRGGDFPLVSLGWTSKINDKLREKYFLDV